MTLDPKHLAALDAAATPGPWKPGLNGDAFADGEGVVFDCDGNQYDAALITYLRNAVPEILSLIEERNRLRADAARYRWLRDHSVPPHNFYISVPDEFHGVKYRPDEVDAYIDEATAALAGAKP